MNTWEVRSRWGSPRFALWRRGDTLDDADRARLDLGSMYDNTDSSAARTASSSDQCTMS